MTSSGFLNSGPIPCITTMFTLPMLNFSPPSTESRILCNKGESRNLGIGATNFVSSSCFLNVKLSHWREGIHGQKYVCITFHPQVVLDVSQW